MLRRLRSLRPLIRFSLPSRNLSNKCFRPAIYEIQSRNGIQSRSFSFTRPGDYDRISNETLEGLFEDLEALNDTSIFSNGYDVEYSNGVLTLKLGAKGTYVINRQPPNQQIWLSSPISGPKRYDYDLERQQWVYKRDGSNLLDLLRTELSQLLAQDIIIR